MKRIIRLFVTSVLTLSIVFSTFCGTVYAGTLKSDDYYSIKEYEVAMSEIYAKYGMEWKITDSSNAASITKELFDSEIARAKKECKEYFVSLMNSKFVNAISTPIDRQGASIYSIMPVTKRTTATSLVEIYPFAFCYLYAEALFTYNADSGAIMSIHSWSIYPMTTMNLDQWVDEGSYVNFSSGPSSYAWFKG